MKIELKSGKSVKLREDLSLDERDELMDSIEYEWGDDNKIKSVKKMNSTMTKFIRTCVDGDTSDKELITWSVEERSEVFVEIQNFLTLGEGKASK